MSGDIPTTKKTSGSQQPESAGDVEQAALNPDFVSPLNAVREPDIQAAPLRGAPSATPASAAKPPTESIALPLGYLLHEYRIDAVLGQGGFGITYLATDVNLNARVAVKEYLPEEFAQRSSDRSVSARNLEDQDFYQTGLDSFLVEARTLATFRHPNLVRVARFFEGNKTAYMVLEYERGQSLKSWRKTHNEVDERELLTLLLPLLDGLAVMHETGFLHRDIKPDNIYVRDENGSLVLLDFGAARQTVGGKADAANVFTPGFAPIEQYYGADRQGPWTDIYALGATVLWLITGRKPIEANDRMTQEDPQPRAEITCKGRYSPEFLRAIDWALQPEPEKRPKDIAEFRTALYAAHASSLGLQEALRAGEKGEIEAAAAGETWDVQSPRLLKGRLVRAGRALVRPASWPLAVKMPLAMVLTALLPMVITAYYNYSGSVASVASSELRNLEQLAKSTAGRISQLIGDSRNLASYLGSDEDFVDLLAHPSEKSKASIKSKLEGVVKANPDVQLVTIFNTVGTVVVSSDPETIGKNFKFRDYFKIAMTGRPHTTGIVIGAVVVQPAIYYSNPVFDRAGKIIGVVLLRIKGSSIARIVDEVQSGRDRIPFVVDADGVIIFHPDQNLLYSSLVPLEKSRLDEIIADQRFRRRKIDSVNLPDLAKVMVGATRGGNVSYYSPISKTEEIAGYAPVEGHNWMVGVSESRKYFAEPLTRLLQNVLYSVVLVGVIFVLLAILFARSIVRPIEKLTLAAHALKRGDYDNANIKVSTNDEIGHLARTFNVMIDVLRQRERERGALRSGRDKGKR